MIENFSIPGYIPGTIGAVAAAVTAVVVAKNLRNVVKPNMVDVVVQNKSINIYGSTVGKGNAYWLWPEWIPVIGRTKVSLPLSVFDIDLVEYDAYDVERVPFVVDIKAFFRINDPAIAGTRVLDMAELIEQLRGILQGTVRTILAKSDIEEALGERSKFGHMFTEQTAEQLKEWGVENVKTIELMDIRDPRDGSSKVISDIMAKRQSAIEKESRVVVADNEKLARVAEIEAAQIADVKDQQAQQIVGERTAEKEKAVGVADEKAKQEIKEQQRVTTEKEMNVHQVTIVRDAEIKKEARIVKAEEERQTKIIDAEAAKQEDIIKAEGQKQQTVTVAEGDLVDQQLEGKGILAVGEATAEAARLLEMARVTPELELAEGIGKNEGYQDYLVRLRNVQKDEEVGKANAKALEVADIKVIANGGTVSTGIEGVGDLFNSRGGQKVGEALEGLANTDVGRALLERVGINNNERGANGSTQ